MHTPPLIFQPTDAHALAARDLPKMLWYGTAPTPFGSGVLSWSDQGIVMLHLQHPEDPSIENQLGQHFPGSILRPSDREAHKRLALIFTAPDDNPHVPTLNIPLVLSGSPFQLKVWQALLDIPFGAVQSYGALATAIGHPGAARAVGTAVAANMLAYLVPCHRVIRACGTRGQYRWGPERKAQILDWETRELARANVSR